MSNINLIYHNLSVCHLQSKKNMKMNTNRTIKNVKLEITIILNQFCAFISSQFKITKWVFILFFILLLKTLIDCLTVLTSNDPSFRGTFTILYLINNVEHIVFFYIEKCLILIIYSLFLDRNSHITLQRNTTIEIIKFL